MSEVKSFALNSAKKLNEQIEVQAMDVDWKSKVEAKPPAEKEVVADSSWNDGIMKSFENKLDDFLLCLSKVLAESDEQALRFAGLGLCSS